MQIFVQTIPQELPPSDRTTAVVIDVLRATSVMATALAHGASAIITCLTIEEAKAVAARLDHRPLLCGERHCRPIEGFDLANSPSEYRSTRIAKQTLIMTTTNGTKALAAARNAKRVLAGSFLNLTAVAKLIAWDDIVHLVCAGTDGVETEEDTLFAGALIERLIDAGHMPVLDPTAQSVLQQWRVLQTHTLQLVEQLAQSRGGRNLVEAGFYDDVKDCAQVDIVSTVPVMVTSDPITLHSDFRLGESPK